MTKTKTDTRLLDVALQGARRGWHVFPCRPRTKLPATRDGFKSATQDEERIRGWWTQNPDFNVGVACGPSGLCVIDCDHGLTAETAWRLTAALGLTGDAYAVRSGRRPEYGLQIYTRGVVPSGKFSVPQAGGEPLTGDVKSAGGYVMAAGSIHPSGETYQVVVDGPVPAVPPLLGQFRVKAPAASLGDAPITSDRNSTLTSIAGKLRGAGLDTHTLRENLHAINERRCEPPLPNEEVDRIADNAERWPVGDAGGVGVRLSVGKESSKKMAATIADALDGTQGDQNAGHWRGLFHTREETENSPDPQFLIRNFLQEQSITGLIGPARARKSIIVVNIIHALLTGEPLFGKFEVTNRPERVVYLCPESGLLALGRRIRNMGLGRFVGESLFYTTMNSELVELDDPRIREASKGAVLFIDTLVRFFGAGEENSATDMKLFFAKCQELMRSGVQAVFVLHHTAKNSDGLKLESGRGSGDFGGSLTAAWGTTLDDFEDAYNSPSLLVPVKERDFRAEGFKVAPSGDDTNFFLQYIDGSGNARVQVGAKRKSGHAQAMAFARANSGMTGEQLRQALALQGIEYGISACRDMLSKARQSGVTTAAG